MSEFSVSLGQLASQQKLETRYTPVELDKL